MGDHSLKLDPDRFCPRELYGPTPLAQRSVCRRTAMLPRGSQPTQEAARGSAKIIRLVEIRSLADECPPGRWFTMVDDGPSELPSTRQTSQRKQL